MKLVIATDAWFPQVNGVVRSLSTTLDHLRARGHAVTMISPDQFLTLPMPGYASIRLAVAPRFRVRRLLGGSAPDLVHIATEGPIGWAARGWCLSHGVPFTSAFHTRFPEYAAVRTGLSPDRFWPVMRRFHAPSSAVLVSTPSLATELAQRGIGPTVRWSRGIDQTLFRPEGSRHPQMARLPGPILLNVGRVAAEKNLEAFLDAPVRGSKVVVGDGPALSTLRHRYPHVVFLGALGGEALASAYRTADCFVFPSRTDTFGLVIIEALACGVPIAAFPVSGPADILTPDAGVMREDLGAAIEGALRLDRQAAARLGACYSWPRATDEFESAITFALGACQTRQAA